jgi:hypothetical protein
LSSRPKRSFWFYRRRQGRCRNGGINPADKTEEGLAGVGVAELLQEAGLTVGGFYKHFDSPDDLVAEAVDSFGGWKRRVDAAK